MTEQAQGCGKCPEGRVRDASGRCVLPEVTLANLVMSLHTTALLHLGDVAHPETGAIQQDLELARHTIDTLALLERKTQGNLEADEAELLRGVVYELRMRYVKARDSV